MAQTRRARRHLSLAAPPRPALRACRAHCGSALLPRQGGAEFRRAADRNGPKHFLHRLRVVDRCPREQRARLLYPRNSAVWRRKACLTAFSKLEATSVTGMLPSAMGTSNPSSATPRRRWTNRRLRMNADPRQRQAKGQLEVLQHPFQFALECHSPSPATACTGTSSSRATAGCTAGNAVVVTPCRLLALEHGAERRPGSSLVDPSLQHRCEQRPTAQQYHAQQHEHS